MKRWIWIVVSVAVLGVLIGWRLHVNKMAAATTVAGQSRKGPATVGVSPATRRDITKSFEATTNIESPQTVKLTPKLSDQIDFLQVHEGDPVTAGQVLVKLDQSELIAQFRQKSATLAEAKARLAQAKVTQNQVNVGIGTGIRQQEAGLINAQADDNQTRQNYAAQIAAADAAVTDAQGRVDNAKASQASAQAAIRSAEANLGDATTKLARLESLYRQNFIAAQDVDDQRAAVSVQKSAVDAAQAQLNAAKAAIASAIAQRDAAQHQADIARTSGKANIDAADARLAQAKASLENARASVAQKPAYVANLQALAADVMAAAGDLANTKAQLDQTVLSAPMNGFVTARYMDPGAMASPGNPILALQSTRQVWANIPVPEEQIRYVHDGMPATVTVDSFPGMKFAGKIIQLNPAADPLSRQFTVRVELDNPQNLLKTGMFGRASFITQKLTNVITVPIEAIQSSDDGGSYVWVVTSQSTVQKKPVKIGLSDDQGMQILAGLDAGDKVVTLYTGKLKDGAIVRVGGKGKHAGAGKQDDAAPLAGGKHSKGAQKHAPAAGEKD
ncbi:MAG: efflux RND transporter periplasmic adaptor subunit [Capsulimonadaceae bacterium]|nr:efflux RND transporter periplasmic adaptor subunit [Capsulimonadaceae bacterium]